MSRIYKSSQGVVVERDGRYFSIPESLSELLAYPLSQIREKIEKAHVAADAPAKKVAPVDPSTEVWASGVTYLRSKVGRMEESEIPDLYSRVYDADRPEIFFKTLGWRVIAQGEKVGIRRDSGWDVPEAEVVLVINAHQEIVGYLLGNDMSSRSIEGENTLYLPQAKSYDKACSLSDYIIPAWEIDEAVFPISVKVERNGEVVFSGESSTSQMKRTFEELASWLYRALSMPNGAYLFTGTGVVPGADFTLQESDVVKFNAGVLGDLINPVTVVG